MRSEFRFWRTQRVRFSEIDAQAVLHNARYLEYFDVGMQEYWRAVGKYESLRAAQDADFQVVNAEVQYRRPILLDEEIDICVRASHAGRTSLVFQVELHGRAVEDLRAFGRLVHVHIDPAFAPAPVQPRYIQLLETFEGKCLEPKDATAP